MNIDVKLAKRLIDSQFPEWRQLHVVPVKQSGWDNRTFHLGNDMSMRLPSRKEYAPQILKESKWLPHLSKHISCKITQPIALGKPSEDYPFHWAINQWLDGETASLSTISNLKIFANDLAAFLGELHAIETIDGPPAGAHNFYRGGTLSYYSADMQNGLAKIKNPLEQKIATALWQDAVASSWQNKPVWLHGDFATGNMLIKDGKLHAIIDFGCLAVGDPACDLAIAWNLLDSSSRQTFKDKLSLDNETWIRGMGWTLWKTLCWPIKGTPVDHILNALYTDYREQLKI